MGWAWFSFSTQLFKPIKTFLCTLALYHLCYLNPSLFSGYTRWNFSHSFLHLFLLLIRPYISTCLWDFLFCHLFLFLNLRLYLFAWSFLLIFNILPHFKLGFFFILLSFLLQFNFLFSFQLEITLLLLLDLFCFPYDLFLSFATVVSYHSPTIHSSWRKFEYW